MRLLSPAALPAGASGRIPPLRRPGGRLAISLIAIAALLATASGLAVALSRGKPVSPAELAQQRSHLAFVAKGLARAQRAVEHEALLAKAAWPAFSDGLPAAGSTSLRPATAALSAARQIPTPRFISIAPELTGPAQGIATQFKKFSALTLRGWGHTLAALRAILKGPPAAASFARANATLYIDSIFQGAADLSTIGEKVLTSYEHLGGEAEFGAALTPLQVSAIAHAYSPEAVSLPAPVEAGSSD